MKACKRLIIWQLSDQLTKIIYQKSCNFPREEVFGLTSQIRRASLSVVLNIIEGYARRTNGDFRRFLDISLGSLSEVEYLLELSQELGYLSDSDYKEIEEIRSECGKCLWSYRQKITK